MWVLRSGFVHQFRKMAELISGKDISAKVKEEIKSKVDCLKKEGKRVPGLAVILVGENPASQVYVRNKTRACEKAGFHHRQIDLPGSTSELELIGKINELNEDPEIDGILVQLPLPDHLDEDNILRLINPDKDVDGFHPANLGKLVLGQECFIPCTPLGIMRMLEEKNISMSGKEVVVVGRSNIVGKPMALLAVQKLDGANATVTVCHSRTKDIEQVISRADVIIAAIGRAKFVTKDMVKEGAVVIDVGINRMEDGKLCGDVDFEEVSKVASAITPVPGGVGPMTIAMLLDNTLRSCLKRQSEAQQLRP